MTPPALFTSPATLEAAFAAGLEDMLAHHPGLGVYILVLANAAYDPALWQGLRPALAERHPRHADEITHALREGRRLDVPEDDLMVFLKLMALGFEHVACLERRACRPRQVLFNPIRALRPPRASGERFDSLTRPFNPAGFHFNKPFLAKEVLWHGELAGKPARLLYNKFPFAPLHGLLVPEPEACHPQCLTPELHGWAWNVTETLGAGLPSLGLAYNSLGAQASVNQLHFQSFLGAPDLPVLCKDFHHRGGPVPYPVPCQVATDATDAWLQLDALHQARQPYNLLYTPGRLIILPRRPQDAVPPPAWTAGPGWSELCGVTTVFSREDFQTLAQTDLETMLTELAP